MNFKVNLPNVVEYGANSIEKVVDYVKEKSKVALISTSNLSSYIDKLKTILHTCSFYIVSDIKAEPSDKDVLKWHNELNTFNPDVIIGLGGGSVLDLAKILSLTLADNDIMKDFWNNAPKAVKKIPNILIPTSAGTGAEATLNAIFANIEKEIKIGIVNPLLLADKVILDPTITYDLPANITATTGVDALCHAVECFISNKANHLSNDLSLCSIKMIFESLPIVYKEPHNEYHRSQMLLASFYAGICIAASGTNIVHALSYPLGGKYHIAHGLANAIILNEGMKYNEDVCVEKFAAIAKYTNMVLSNASSKEASKVFLNNLSKLLEEINIPKSLLDLNIPEEDIDSLTESAFEVQRLLKNNPKTVTKEDIKNIYKKLF